MGTDTGMELETVQSGIDDGDEEIVATQENYGTETETERRTGERNRDETERGAVRIQRSSYIAAPGVSPVSLACIIPISDSREQV